MNKSILPVSRIGGLSLPSVLVLPAKTDRGGPRVIDGDLVLEDVKRFHRVEHCDSLLRKLIGEVIVEEGGFP